MRVATFLRASHAPIEFEYPHSGLTLNLHGNVLESEFSFEARLAYMTSFAALHAHHEADFVKALDRVKEHYTNAFYSIPYYGKLFEVSKDDIPEDIKAMAERYKRVFKKTVS